MSCENTLLKLENASESDILTEELRHDIVTYIHQDTGWQEAGERLRVRFPRTS